MKLPKKKLTIPVIAALIGSGLTLVVGMALGSVTPASASWHGTCPPYHNGDLCFYSGYNGTGTRTVIPEDSIKSRVGTCTRADELPLPEGGAVENDSNWESVQTTYVHVEVYMWNNSGCSGPQDDILQPYSIESSPVRNLANDFSLNDFSLNDFSPQKRVNEANKILSVKFILPAGFHF